jgi:hypothetical protein
MSFFSNTWINGASSQVDVVGGLSGGCYLYFSDNSRLTIPVTTGFVEIAYATFSGNTGLAPDFTKTPIDSPVEAKQDFSKLVWNFDDANVTSLNQIFNRNFNGVVDYVILDGVSYVLNQGPVDTPNQEIPSSPEGSPSATIVDSNPLGWVTGACSYVPNDTDAFDDEFEVAFA